MDPETPQAPLTPRLNLDRSFLTGRLHQEVKVKYRLGHEPSISSGEVVEAAIGCCNSAVQEMAKRIFPLCKSFLLISQFVESRSQFKNGPVNHPFAAALILLDYQTMVAQLEHQFRLGRLSIQGP